MDLTGRPIMILDLETAASADDCVHCGCDKTAFDFPPACTNCEGHQAIGWNNKRALGLSIGCYWNYQDMAYHWFDPWTLEATVQHFVATRPLMVSFNGLTFDFALMRALLRGEVEELAATEERTGFIRSPRMLLQYEARMALCDQFKNLCAHGYDVLQEIWKVDSANRFGKGLNSLNALAVANGLGPKEMDGATAPRLWAHGRYAEVIGYNVGDVAKTRWLFERACAGQTFLRGNGLPIQLTMPILPQRQE